MANSVINIGTLANDGTGVWGRGAGAGVDAAFDSRSDRSRSGNRFGHRSRCGHKCRQLGHASLATGGGGYLGG